MTIDEQIEVRRRMQIHLLGTVEASADERPVSLGGAKQRAVLAMLGLEANRLVSADRLIEGLWGEEPPASAGKMVQNYVWRLRKVLADGGDAEIVTRGRGYELQIDRELIDVLRFERLVGEATRGVSGDAARQALALFRGEPLADIAEEPFAGAEIRRLEELHLVAAELAIDADLAAGRHQEIVGEIDGLLADHPLRERLHAQRLLALYRSGRQAEALDAYREARSTLVEEIGIEPGPELQQLHAAILRQDPALTVEPPALALPAELEHAGAATMVGRERELQALRRLWRQAAAGQAVLVTLVGAYGMGKTRVAAALAGEVHAAGATVLYASGAGPSEAALAALGRAADARRPTLLVVDDADRARVEVRQALREFGAADRPVLTIATGLQAAALARLNPEASLPLEPLDAEAVAAIAALYAPAGGEIPATELLRASRGAPRRVHEAASEWARRFATDRVDALARSTAAGRGQAWALGSELTDSLIDLQSTLERTEDRPARATIVCPYKGLASFDADDADFFFGREGLVAELVAHLVGARLLALVGPSGSGKSSVLRAGLLPALAGGVLPGSQHWPQTVIRPGTHPARELRRRALDPRGVLAVDQFEELFTACADEAERAEFVAALLEAPRVVIAIRADFYGRCAVYPRLSRALADNHVLVGPMTRDELRRAIERPARRAGLVVEPELTDALLADVDGEPGALPLLSTSLLELWGRRDGQRLPLAAYARLGGVQGAVARLAEEAFVALAPDRQAAARTLFLRLSDEDENGTVVRRRIALDEQDAGVVAELAQRRLLTVSEGTVEVAHEALLREWPRLRGWIDEDIAGRRLHRHLRDAARVWDAEGRDAGALYRGATLAAALDWAAKQEGELERPERAFLEAGRRASGAAQRRLRAGLAGVATLLVLASIAGLVAWHQRDEARTRQTEADAERLGGQALASGDLDLSLLLAREGVALHDTAQTRGNLFAALLKSPAAIGIIRGLGTAEDLTPAPDGRSVLASIPEKGMRVIDVPARRVTAPPALQDVNFPNFDHRGDRVATAGTSPALRDARTWAARPRLETLESIYDVGFSADDREVFVLQGAASRTTELQRLDARSGAPLGPPRVVFTGRVGEVNLPSSAVLVTKDGRHVVTLVGGEVALRDARTLEARWTLDNTAVEHVALSPDGGTLLLAGTDGSLDFVGIPSGVQQRIRRPRAVVQVAFSPDGRTAATAEADNRIVLWDVARRTVRDTLTGHIAPITALTFTRDGHTLLSAGLDGTLMLWDVDGSRGLARTFPSTRAPAPPALSPDGRTLAVPHADGTVSLVEPSTLRTRVLRVGDGLLGGIAFTDDHHLLATVPRHGRGYGAVVDLRSGQPGQRRPALGSPSRPSVDAAGRRLALVWHGAAEVQPLSAGRPVGHARFYRRSGGALGVAISPDGHSLAVLTASGIEIVDVGHMRISGFLPGSDTTVTAPVFVSNQIVAAGTREGWVGLWSAATSRALSGHLAAHSGAVVAVAASPDGHTLASGGTDGFVRLFDADTRQPLPARLPVSAESPAFPVFSRDGSYLLATTASGQGYRWDVRPSSWFRRACAIAGRDLTRGEWSDALPGRAYTSVC